MKALIDNNLDLLARAEKGSDFVPELIAALQMAVETDPSSGAGIAAKLARMIRRGAPAQQHNAWLAILAMERGLGSASNDFAWESKMLQDEGYAKMGGLRQRNRSWWLLW